eukprot:5541691-Alexandrium_andersonii.AAC.1
MSSPRKGGPAQARARERHAEGNDVLRATVRQRESNERTLAARRLRKALTRDKCDRQAHATQRQHVNAQPLYHSSGRQGRCARDRDATKVERYQRATCTANLHTPSAAGKHNASACTQGAASTCGT